MSKKQTRPLGTKVKWKTNDRSYAPLPPERDSISGPTQQAGAFDARKLFAKQKPVPSNVVNKHDGSPYPGNDGEKAVDLSMGRRSFRQPGDDD
jgi:hypothetical protein